MPFGVTPRVHTLPGSPVSSAPGGQIGAEPTVLVVDDHPLFAQSLAFALRLQNLSTRWLGGRPPHVSDLSDQITQGEVGVVVLGITLADDSVDVALIRACRAADARVLLVVRSLHEGLAARAMLAGAEAVVDKGRPFDELTLDLFRMIVGDDDMPRQPRVIAAADVEKVRRSARRQIELDSLSPREREVLGCLMDGQTVDEIAGMLALSVATVRTHVRAILTKLGVNCQLAAVAAAHRAVRRADSQLDSS